MCLGAQHARSALEGAGCVYCDFFTIRGDRRDRDRGGRYFSTRLLPVTHVCMGLSLDWSVEKQERAPSSCLDERILAGHRRSFPPSLPFLSELHSELLRSWRNPFSARVFPPASIFMEGSYLALEAMPADLLRDTDAVGGVAPAETEELRRSSDLALHASKQAARAIGRSLAALIVTERHLWLNLSRLEEKDRSFLLDAPVSPSRLFRAAVEMVVRKFREAKDKSAAFECYISRKRPSALTPEPVPAA
ncbi:3-phosphoshikimate 1-carboxyvinyltransferase [Labeo rohita]|uniref:3-phosphoshikimate 1-carboxyvinyltransferase n=1 Tax=Labeo rohita TaxID=84645 RepID=A0ABQ8M834_LABRO|nr:3-phosphoshikimate 1-carboxyvinyltransferase [Labeo rohita]